MRFVRYHKIYDRAPAGKDAQPSGSSSYDTSTTAQSEWIVQEKIHGANFSIHVTESDIRYAKRGAFLDFDQDCFNDFQRLDDVLRPAARKLWQTSQISTAPDQPPATKRACKQASAASCGEAFKQIAIYGELFGGYLPSEKEAQLGWDALFRSRTTAASRQASCNAKIASRAVQEGVYYASDVKFIVFDIVEFWDNHHAKVGQKDGERTTTFRFWDYDSVKDMGSAAGFLVSDVLLRTPKYADAANYDVNTLQSQLALKLNPNNAALKLLDNLAEGVVIRPAGGAEVTIMKELPVARFMLKRKPARFSEEIDNVETMHGGETPEAVFRTRVARLVNLNRLASVVSKAPQPEGVHATAEEWSFWTEQIVSDFAEDVWEAFWASGCDLGSVDYDMGNEYVENECRCVVGKRYGVVS
ncbi:unnamed protein product [Amoebophrya sp. A25]|nr:unnamed protein product [Amoebophrya sp. A25]|eukprot:GSA25T00027433001.1